MKGITNPDLKPYAAYRESGIDWLEEVPAHWDVPRIKTVMDNIVERPFETQKVDLFIGMENVESWTGRLIDVDNTVGFDSQCKAFKAGDTLFGKLRPYLAKVVRAHRKGICVGEFLVLRSASARAHDNYLEFLLRSKPVISNANSRTYGARMPRTNWAFVGAMQIPLPPLAEQVAIARFLDYVDRRVRRVVEAKEKQVGLLEELRASTIAEAVTGRIDVRTGQPYPAYGPSGMEWLKELSSHWEVVPLASISRPKSISGYPQFQLLSVFLDRGVIPFHEEAQKRTNVTSLNLSRYQVVDPGDFVLNNQQAWRGSVGVSEHSGIVSPAYLVLSLNNKIDSGFANWLLRSPTMVSQYVISSRGVGTIQRNLYWPQVKRVKLPLPPLAEQTVIAEYLSRSTDKMNAAIFNTHREIELFQEYSTRVIADVVTGKLDVREAVGLMEGTDA